MILRDLLSFSTIDILVKSADQKSYHAILQELKDKEIYNMIVDIHDAENMSDFLKAVRLIYVYGLVSGETKESKQTFAFFFFFFKRFWNCR